MEKNFSEWQRVKTELQRNEGRAFFYKREIWFCSIGLNLGHEEDGKGKLFLRPVIIMEKMSRDLFWAIPITSSMKGDAHCLQFKFRNRTQTALISQMRVFDRKRLLRKIGTLPASDFSQVVQEVIDLIFKTVPLLREGHLGGRSH